MTGRADVTWLCLAAEFDAHTLQAPARVCGRRNHNIFSCGCKSQKKMCFTTKMGRPARVCAWLEPAATDDEGL